MLTILPGPLIAPCEYAKDCAVDPLRGPTDGIRVAHRASGPVRIWAWRSGHAYRSHSLGRGSGLLQREEGGVATALRGQIRSHKGPRVSRHFCDARGSL